MVIEAPDSARMSRCAGVAQLVEQRIRNAKVVGSTPISGTKSPNDHSGLTRAPNPLGSGNATFS
jgi:hypothetical protein